MKDLAGQVTPTHNVVPPVPATPAPTTSCGALFTDAGEVLHVSLETRFQQLHVDTGKLTPGPNGTVEVDVPLSNIGSPTLGRTLQNPAGAAYVREGVLAAPLEPIDSASPYSDYVLATC